MKNKILIVAAYEHLIEFERFIKDKDAKIIVVENERLPEAKSIDEILKDKIIIKSRPIDLFHKPIIFKKNKPIDAIAKKQKY